MKINEDNASPDSVLNASLAARTTGEALIEGVVAHSVDTVFGIPGVQTYPLFDALAKRSNEITLISARHEQSCSYMALGYAQSTGRPGVCCVVPGPGVLNAAAGLLTAGSTSTPVVMLTSEIPSRDIGRGLGHLHEMRDQLCTLRSFTKWAANVARPDDAAGLIAEAFHQACSGRPGPAVVAAPWDVLAQSSAIEPVSPLAITYPSADSDALEAAGELLAGARNPMIMVGGGARHASPEVRALASYLQAPVVSFRSGRGIVSDRDPLGSTCAAGYDMWSATDVLVGIGSRQELVWARWPDRPSRLRTINIDIDPDQHDRLQPTVALTADAREATRQLLALVTARRPAAPSRADEFAAIKRQAYAAQSAYLQPHTDYLDAIRDVLTDDGYFVEEISQMGFSSIFGMPIYEPRHYITAGYQGTLGFGFPTSLGVKAAHPDAPVISVTGDGGFLFGATELATAVKHGLGVVTVVFDNDAYGNVKADQLRLYSRVAGANLKNPDFVELARAFGADGYRATTPGELRGVLERALGANGPAVVHVPMPLDPAASPWRFLTPASRQSDNSRH